MSHADDYYDFNCGNDRKLVKIAIKNDHFHTITVRASVAMTIDFSGGTRRVETIRLAKCFKMTRIIWPERTGAIRRLYIHNADTLTRLDISALTSLEELSILNCRSLEEIAGLPATLKELNVHNVKLNSVDLSSCKHLQKINLVTRQDHTNLDLSQHQELQIAYTATNKHSLGMHNISNLNFTNCNALHTIFIDTGENPVALKLNQCVDLREIAVTCGVGSDEQGLHDCKDIEFLQLDKNLRLHETTKISLQKIQQFIKNSPHVKNPQQKLKSYLDMGHEFHKHVLRTKPDIHDRETIIQESGSLIEVDRSRDAKITLLSAPIDIETLSASKSLMNELRKFTTDNTYFAPAVMVPIYLVPELPALAVTPAALRGMRIPVNKNPIKDIEDFIQNPERVSPNYFYISQKQIKTPEIREFIQSLLQPPAQRRFNNKPYLLQPNDKVVIHGDRYYLTNAIPGLGNGATSVPASAFAAGADAPAMSPEAAAEAQQEFIQASARLSEYALRNNRSLSQRNKNLQVLRRAAEIKKISNNFLRNYNNAVIPNLASQDQPSSGSGLTRSGDWTPQTDLQGRAATPDGQIPIDGDNQRRQRNLPPIEQHGVEGAAEIPPEPPPDLKGKKAPQEPFGGNSKTLPRRDNDYDDQVGIEGAAEAPPDLKEKTAPQVPFGGTSKTLPRTDKDYDDQVGIEGAAEAPPDLKGKTALQVPFGGNSNNQPRADKPYDDQVGIEGASETPPDLKGKTAPQITFGGNSKTLPRRDNDYDDQVGIEGAAETPPDLKGKTAPQVPFGGSNKTLPRTDKDYDDQVGIEGAAETPPDLNGKTAPQAGIQVNKSAGPLADVPPLIPEPNNQLLLKAARNLADAVQRMRNEIEPYHDQFLIDVGKGTDTATNNTPQLYVTAEKLAKAVSAMLDKTDGLPEQVLINAAAASTPEPEPMKAKFTPQVPIDASGHTIPQPDVPPLQPEPNHQLLLQAAKKVALAVQEMTNKIGDLPDQVLIHAQAKSEPEPETMQPKQALQENISAKSSAAAENKSETNNQRLILDAAKQVAIATKQMLDNTEGLPEQILIHKESMYQDPYKANIELLHSSREMAHAIQSMVGSALAIDPSNPSPSVVAAGNLAQITLHELKNKRINKQSLFECARSLIFCMRLLNNACEDELKLNEKPEHRGNDNVRMNIIKILENANRQYIKDHDLHAPGSNIFGRTPDERDIRSEIMAKFISALLNYENLDVDETSMQLNKLLKDHDLRFALGGIEAEIKECLTGVHTPSPKPQLKEEK